MHSYLTTCSDWETYHSGYENEEEHFCEKCEGNEPSFYCIACERRLKAEVGVFGNIPLNPIFHTPSFWCKDCAKVFNIHRW